MSQINTDTLANFIRDTWQVTCEVRNLEVDGTRFSLGINCEDLSLQVIASEARICLSIHVNELSAATQTALLSQVSFIKENIEKDLNPYKITLWKDEERTYTFVPDIQKLKENSKFSIDICTPPCDISNGEKSLHELKGLLRKSLEWLLSMRDTYGDQEGERSDYLSSRVERSQRNRELCLAIHGYDCKICGLSLTKKYGSLADQFIHVHHIESIAAAGPRWIDPSKDLITVCPNCHAMLHRKSPPLLPEELKKIIKEQKNG